VRKELLSKFNFAFGRGTCRVQNNFYCSRLEKYHTEVENIVNQFPVKMETKTTKEQAARLVLLSKKPKADSSAM